jgi:hypothetical protein
MRLLIAGLILSVAPTAYAAGPKGQCKNRCDSNYQFCLNRARTKQARKSCKADLKSCKGTCK